jgi:hypothetical protein
VICEFCGQQKDIEIPDYDYKMCKQEKIEYDKFLRNNQQLLKYAVPEEINEAYEDYKSRNNIHNKLPLLHSWQEVNILDNTVYWEPGTGK